MTLLQLGLILVQSFKKINQEDVLTDKRIDYDDELSEALLNDIKGLVDLFNGLNIIIDLLSELYDITISVGLPDDLYLKEPESPPESDW